MKELKRFIILFFIPLHFSISGDLNAQTKKVDWKKVNVLVYTKNGKGYVHDNIPSAVSCIQKLGKQYGFKVDTSADASGNDRKKS